MFVGGKERNAAKSFCLMKVEIVEGCKGVSGKGENTMLSCLLSFVLCSFCSHKTLECVQTESNQVDSRVCCFRDVYLVVRDCASFFGSRSAALA